MRRIRTLLIACLILSGINGFAQVDNAKYFQAEDLIEDGNFHKALEIYQQLLEESPNNANLNFKMGFCYLNTATEKTKAIPYLEFAAKHITDDYKELASKEEKAPIEALFFLGKAYQVNYRFDDAERVFFELKQQISADQTQFLKEIDNQLAACQYARLLMKTPVEMTVSNLGKNVNTEFTEHSPVISGDETTLIFTSKRKGNTGGIKTDDGQYFEDIYISELEGKKFGLAKQISNNINTNGHEASIGLSFDGSILFIYRDDNGDGNIYQSKRSGSDWGVPEPLPRTVNSKYRETHASMSFDGNEIYFTSDRKGGFGGLDIYRVRKLPNGSWSRAQNLGPNINTPLDEEGPYLHPDGTSLFFSSEGHNTMGGFDIFVSYIDQENDKWLKPENIGYPINTPDDDVYYVPSVDGRRAYYASYANNSIGYYDIFRIDLSESHVRNQTVIAGIARVNTREYLIDGIISISTMNDELVGVYTPDEEKRRFLAILPRGHRYKVLFESSNFDSFEKIIEVPEFAYDQSGKVVNFDDIVVGGSDPQQLNNNILVQNSTEENSTSSIDLPTEENKVSSIIGDKTLAKSGEMDDTYNSQSVYSENDDLQNRGEEYDGLENKEDTDELIASKETNYEAKGEDNLDGNTLGTKEKAKVNSKNQSKSRLIYYILGLLGVTILGFVFVRRKSS